MTTEVYEVYMKKISQRTQRKVLYRTSIKGLREDGEEKIA